MEEIKVYTGTYLNGRPANDEYEIRVAKGVTISLNNEAFTELANAITNKAGEDLSAMQGVADRYEKRRKKTIDFCMEIRKVFYDMSDDYGIRYTKEEVDFDKLDEVLDKYGDLLGFE